MPTIINHSLDWPRSEYEDVLLVPMYVVTGITTLSFILTTIYRLLWWDHTWPHLQTMKRIDQKIITYAFHNFFEVLEGREKFEKIMDANKNLKEIQSQTFADEVDAGEAEKTIQSVRSTIKVNKANILKNKHAINMLSMYSHTILLLVFTSFWDIFIIEETFGCDEHRDCYVGDNNQTPISNCDLINPRNTSVICYRLLFDSVNGLASVGGITFVAIGGFGLMSYVVLLVQDTVKSHCIRIILGIIIFVLQYTVIFANLGYFIYLQISRRRLHQAYQVSYAVQACICFVAAFICITTPWVIIVWSWIMTRHQQVRLLKHVRSHTESVSSQKDLDEKV